VICIFFKKKYSYEGGGMKRRKLKIAKLEERIVLDAAVTGDAAEPPSEGSHAVDVLDPNGPLYGLWPVVGQDAGNTGYNEHETLLTPDNVDTLTQEWLGGDGSFFDSVAGQPALSWDNTLYAGNSQGQIYALDAETGETIWNTQTTQGDLFITTPVLTKDTLYISDGNIFALDINTGDILWQTSVNSVVEGTAGEFTVITADTYADFVNGSGDSLTAGDLAAMGFNVQPNGDIVEPVLDYSADMTIYHDDAGNRDLLVIGISSEQNFHYNIANSGYFDQNTGNTTLLDQSEFSVVGHIAAFDAATGELVWKVPTVDASAGAAGGGAWASIAYDADRNVVYTGIGQHHRLPSETPSFDYTDSILAINGSTGEVIDHIQFTENDVWAPIFADHPVGRDWDVNTHANLFSSEIDGEKVDLVGIGDKSGSYHFMLLNDNGSMEHITTLEVDPFSVGGTIQSTPAVHDGAIVITSMAALQDPVSGQLVDPHTGFKLITFPGLNGFLLPEIVVNPAAIPVDLSTTERVSLNAFGDPVNIGFANGIFYMSNKTTSIDIQTLLNTPDVLNAIDNNNVAELTPDASDSYVNFIDYIAAGQSFGPMTVAGANDGDPTNDLYFQTFSDGQIRVLDGTGTERANFSIDNNGQTPNLAGGVTIGPDGSIYVGYGLYSAGGIAKFDLPNVELSASDEAHLQIAAARDALHDQYYGDHDGEPNKGLALGRVMQSLDLEDEI
jgi:outer membrane protein assembly factor BamB